MFVVVVVVVVVASFAVVVSFTLVASFAFPTFIGLHSFFPVVIVVLALIVHFSFLSLSFCCASVNPPKDAATPSPPLQPRFLPPPSNGGVVGFKISLLVSDFARSKTGFLLHPLGDTGWGDVCLRIGFLWMVVLVEIGMGGEEELFFFLCAARKEATRKGVSYRTSEASRKEDEDEQEERRREASPRRFSIRSRGFAPQCCCRSAPAFSLVLRKTKMNSCCFDPLSLLSSPPALTSSFVSSPNSWVYSQCN